MIKYVITLKIKVPPSLNAFNLISFPIFRFGAYLMKVITESCLAH